MESGLMKTLLLLRHAKSSHDQAGVNDHDRVLNGRGEKDAPQVGKRLKRERLVPDAVVSSTAVRAKETARLVAEACNYRGEIDLRRSLYLAPPEAYLETLRSLPDEPEVVLMVGHNAGISDLASRLSGDFVELPTAGLAVFEVELENWSDVSFDLEFKLREISRPD